MTGFSKAILRICSVLALTVGLALPAWASVELSGRDYSELRKMIFLNECSGKNENLIVWNEGEEFPSLGVGHFVWHTQNGGGRPFDEKFPQLIAYLEKHGKKIPSWIKELPDKKAPWSSREEFMRDKDGPCVTSLRTLLTQTTRLQTSFIAERADGLLPKLLRHAPRVERRSLRDKFNALRSTKKGLFAIIDYTSFKGEGFSGTEQYGGQGWGLLQVLEFMRTPPNPDEGLREFVYAAQAVLDRRVSHSPVARGEKRWLSGWKRRVARYLE